MVTGIKTKLILLTQEHQDVCVPVFPPSTEAVTCISPGGLPDSLQQHGGQMLDKLSSLAEDALLAQFSLTLPEVSCPSSECLSHLPSYSHAPALQL